MPDKGIGGHFKPPSYDVRNASTLIRLPVLSRVGMKTAMLFYHFCVRVSVRLQNAGIKSKRINISSKGNPPSFFSEHPGVRKFQGKRTPSAEAFNTWMGKVANFDGKSRLSRKRPEIGLYAKER